jgi:hypothetical protein
MGHLFDRMFSGFFTYGAHRLDSPRSERTGADVAIQLSDDLNFALGALFAVF